MSRRSFLRTAAVAGTAVASAGLTGGIGKPQIAHAQDITWAKEADVVVLGSGSGQMAAIRAASNGLSVVVLEKAATGGGTTGISGGGIWVPNNFLMQQYGIADSRENAIEYLSHATFGQSSPELIESYVDNVNPMVEFGRTVGIDWTILPQFQDYYPEFPGGVPEGRTLSPVSTIEGASGGGALARMMQAAAEELGVEYIFSTPAKRLVINPEGEVIGVVAEQEGTEYNVRALRAVIIATGGFDHNPEMVSAFLRGPIYYPSAVRGNTGDGHLMGMALGANLRNMNEVWGWPMFSNDEGGYGVMALPTEMGKPGCIVVNTRGKRFFNEASAYDPATRTFYDYDNGTHSYENIPAYFIADSTYASRYTIAYQAIEGNPMVTQYDTLAALAEALGIDAAALEETVARFNEYAAQGIDPDYHRGESAFDQLTGGDRTRTDVPHPNLAPVVEAPFYAAKVLPGALGTCGGLQINGKAQVLNVWGEVIPHLYALGNASGSVMGAGYPGGGATVGAGMTFGYIAADDIAAN